MNPDKAKRTRAHNRAFHRQLWREDIRAAYLRAVQKHRIEPRIEAIAAERKAA